MYKGPDRATIALHADSEVPTRDEIRLYLDARYVSASEAYARIMGWDTHQVRSLCILHYQTDLAVILAFSGVPPCQTTAGTS